MWRLDTGLFTALHKDTDPQRIREDACGTKEQETDAFENELYHRIVEHNPPPYVQRERRDMEPKPLHHRSVGLPAGPPITMSREVRSEKAQGWENARRASFST